MPFSLLFTHKEEQTTLLDGTERIRCDEESLSEAYGDEICLKITIASV